MEDKILSVVVARAQFQQLCGRRKWHLGDVPDYCRRSREEEWLILSPTAEQRRHERCPLPVAMLAESARLRRIAADVTTLLLSRCKPLEI